MFELYNAERGPLLTMITMMTVYPNSFCLHYVHWAGIVWAIIGIQFSALL